MLSRHARLILPRQTLILGTTVLKRLWRSKRGLSTIVASLLMVLIVISTSVIVGVFYGGVLRSLLVEATFASDIFTVVHSGDPSITGNRVLPPGPPFTFSPQFFCTGASPVSSPVSGNVVVPAGEVCTVSASVGGSIGVHQGGTLMIQGNSVGGNIVDDRASLVSIRTTVINGNVQLYGTGSATITGVQLGGNLFVTSGGTVWVEGNTVGGNMRFEDTIAVTVKGNGIPGNLIFDEVLDCASSGNTVVGRTIGQCLDRLAIDIMNTGATSASLTTMYLDSKLSNSIAWTLVSSSPNCQGQMDSYGLCNSFPVVIPARQVARVILVSLTNPTGPVQVLIWSQSHNFSEARIDPKLGLLCSTSSMIPPRSFSFC